jgi:hypothetical protein
MRPEAIGSPGTGSISLEIPESWQVSKPSDGCDELARPSGPTNVLALRSSRRFGRSRHLPESHWQEETWP